MTNQHLFYWDLSDRERAALTRDDVERFIDAELMTKGVLGYFAARFRVWHPVAYSRKKGREASHG